MNLGRKLQGDGCYNQYAAVNKKEQQLHRTWDLRNFGILDGVVGEGLRFCPIVLQCASVKWCVIVLCALECLLASNMAGHQGPRTKGPQRTHTQRTTGALRTKAGPEDPRSPQSTHTKENFAIGWPQNAQRHKL